MKIYPIGTVAAATSIGTIDSINYKMFEPNNGCFSSKQHSVLTSRFLTQTLLTRKKAQPFLTITYKYSNVYDREFRQIEHFLDDNDDALTSFYVADFSKGKYSDNIASTGGNWVVTVDNTGLFSEVTNQKADRALIWNGKKWKEGAVDNVVTNATIAIDVSSSNFGSLTLANAQTKSYVYPMYKAYAIPNNIQSFKVGGFLNDIVKVTDDGGYIRSGDVTFTSKYKV